MKKTLILTILFILLTSIAACSQINNKDSQGTDSKKHSNSQIASQASVQVSSNSLSISDRLKKCVSDNYISTYTLDEESVYFVVNDDQKNEHTLYGISARDENIKKYVLESNKSYKNMIQKIMKIQILGDSISVYYDVNSKIHVLLLDRDFNLKKHIKTKEKCGLGFPSDINICLMPKSKKILYYKDYFSEGSDEGGFYTTDYDGGNKKILFSYNSMKKNSYHFNSADSFLVSEDENLIYFIGSYIKTYSENDIHSYGIYNIKNKSFKVYDGARESIIQVKNTFAFTDSCDKNDRDFSGNISCLSEEKKIDCVFESKIEGIVGGLSDEGNYYYSCQSDEGQAKIKVYDKATCKKIIEKNINKYVENVFIFEKAKKIVLWYLDENGNSQFMEYDI